MNKNQTMTKTTTSHQDKKRSRSSIESLVSPSQHCRKNPFLHWSKLTTTNYGTNVNDNNDDDNNTSKEDEQEKEDYLVILVLKFTETDATQHSEREAVACKLVKALQEIHGKTTTKTFPSSSIQPIHVAMLLLPWTLSQVVNQQQQQQHSSNLDSIVWSAMSISLQVLVKAGRTEIQHPNDVDTTPIPTTVTTASTKSFVSRILSQSVLFKLVPKVASDILLSSPTINCDPGEKLEDVFVLYQMLLQLFQPSMEIACKNILIPLAMKINTTQSQSNKRLRNILSVTIKWIHSIHFVRKGNPKTTFQLLSNRSILIALAQVYKYLEWDNGTNTDPSSIEDGTNTQDTKLIYSLLCDGFFHPRHHMEGFVSLLSKETLLMKLNRKHNVKQDNVHEQFDHPPQEVSLFKSYHESLLVIVADSLTIPKAFTTDETTTTTILLLPVIQILPILLQGFLEQSKIWDQQERKLGKNCGKKKAETLILAQFQLFQLWVYPLLSMIDTTISERRTVQCSNISFAAMYSLRQMLLHVLDYDAYTPAHHHDELFRHQYPFLERIGATIRNIATFPVTVRTSLLTDAVHCLIALLRLNHLLLHDTMTDCIVLSLTSRSMTMFKVNVELLSTVVDTYRQLRQQRQIVGTILSATKLLTLSTNANKLDCLEHLNNLLESPQLALAITSAIQFCPINETKSVLVALDAWIHEFVGSVSFLSNGLDIAVRLSYIILRHIQVGQGTARDVAVHCKLLVENTVTTLAVASRSSDSQQVARRPDFVKAALTLCGLALDLHARCEFWLGRKHQLPVPEALQEIVESVSKQLSLENGSEALEWALSFLACHRLQQLHMHIHDEVKNEMEKATNNATQRSELFAEAMKLAHLLGTRSVCTRGRGWMIVAQYFNFWLPYAIKEQIDQFLRWVIMGGAISLGQQMRPNTELSKEMTEEEIETTRCLLCDWSFFEHSSVSSRIGVVGFQSAANMLMSVLSSSISTGSDARRLFSFLPDGSFVKLSTPAELLCNEKDPHRILVNCGKDAIVYFDQALSTISLVNGLPLDFLSRDDFLNFLDLTLLFDHDLQSICFTDSELIPSAMGLMTALRYSASKLITNNNFEKRRNIFIEGEGAIEFGFGLMFSASSLIVPYGSIAAKESKDLLNRTGDLIECLLLSEAHITIDSAILLSEHFQKLQRTVPKVTVVQLLILSYLTRRFLHGLCAIDWPILFDSEESNTLRSHLRIVIDCTHELAKKTIETIDSSRSGILFTAIPDDGDPYSEGLLLLADLLRIRADWLPTFSQIRMELEELCIENLLHIRSIASNVAKLRVLSYLVGCLTDIQQSKQIALAITSALIDNKLSVHDTNLLDACFCHTIKGLQADDIRSLSEKLTDQSTYINTHSLGSRMRLIRFLLRYLIKADQIEAMSHFARKFFSLALEAMCTTTNVEEPLDGQVVMASALIEELTKRRDVIMFRESELALLLSYTCSTLSNAEKGTDLRSTNESCVLNSIAGLFSTTFQRYTKQLYTCAPSVISVFYGFLRHAIRDPSDDSTKLITERGQRFARMCEVLVAHKDIYKKHTIGLVLEFVQALGGTMESDVRDSLIPSIYFLLDTMSKFETQQLEAHMDTKAKTQFRSIYHGYQKIHTYKGH